MRQGNQARQGGRIIPTCIDLSRLPVKPKLYEIKKRNNEIDILPFIVTMDWYPRLRDFKPYEIGPEIGIKPGEDDYKLQYAFHRRLGPEKKDYLCLRHMFGEPCPACEDLDPIWEKKKDDRTKADKEKADALKHKWRCLYNIFDYHDPDVDCLLWDYSYSLFEDFLQDKIEGDDGGILDFTDTDEGKTITFDGKEKSLGDSTFYEAEGIRFKDRDPYEENIYDETFPLDTLLVIPTYDEIANAMMNISTGGGRGEEEEETRSSRRRGRSRSRDEEPPEEERPQRGRRRRREPEPEQEDDLPPHVEGTCPEGLVFGVDYNSDEKCQSCDQGAFDSCADYFDELERREKEDNGGGRRRRSRR